MKIGPYNCNITQFAPCSETDFEKKRLFCGLMETPYWYPSERHQQPTFCVDATTGFLAK